MDILSIAPYIAVGLAVLGAVIYLEIGRRRDKADDARFNAKQDEIDRKWDYLIQLWREREDRGRKEVA